MSEHIIVEKESFIEKLLNPVSRLADNICLNLESDNVNTICNSQNGDVVVYAKMEMQSKIAEPLKLNIPDLKKFVRLLDFVEKDVFEVTINDNNISYKDDGSFNFVYYLLEDGYIPKNTLNINKINSLDYQTSFDLTISKFNDVMKGCAITSDSNKLYLFTKEGKVYAELNDRETPNINNITYQISTEFEGDDITTPIPLKLDSVRMISGLKTSKIKVSFNSKFKITIFEIKEGDVLIKFIISALTK
jgi:hypothetical protein